MPYLLHVLRYPGLLILVGCATALSGCLVSPDEAARRRDIDGDGSDFPTDCEPSNPDVTGAELEETCGDLVVNVCDSTLAEAIAACAWTDDIDESTSAEEATRKNTALADADLRIDGNDSRQLVAMDLGSSPDMDGDGRPDLVVGAPYADAYSGAVTFFSGATRGRTTVSDSNIGRITGSNTTSMFGEAVEVAFDPVEGTPLIVASANESADECGGYQPRVSPGSVYVFYGQIRDEVNANEAAVRLLDCDGWGFGNDLALLGARSESGPIQVLVGLTDTADAGDVVALLSGDLREAAASGGAVTVEVGADTMVAIIQDLAPLWDDGSADSLEVGRDLTNGGDVDGDGVDDVVLGVSTLYGVSGAVLIPGPIDPEDDGIAYLSEGVDLISTTNENVASRVETAGDVDGDGYGDMIFGNGDLYGYGAAVVLGAGPITTVETDLDQAVAHVDGAWEGDYAGEAVLGNFDVNGDGLSDIAVGAPADTWDGLAPNSTNWEGAAFVITAPLEGNITPICATWYANGNCATYRLEGHRTLLLGESFDDEAGSALASPGDVNGDGLDDLIVGADLYGSNGVGAIYLMLTGGY